MTLMKLIAALVRLEELGSVQAALQTLDLHQMSASEVLVRDKEENYTLIYRSATIRVNLVPRIRVEIIVEDALAAAAVAAIVGAAFRGESDPVSAGKVFVRPLEEYISVRSPRPEAVAALA